MNKEYTNNRCLPNPLCKFGPGGDFTTNWSMRTANAKRQGENAVSKVLWVIADIIGATVNSETLASAQGYAGDQKQIYPTHSQEIVSIECKKIRRPGNATSTEGSKRHRSVRGQTMLFSDDRRDSARAKRKPNNNIRAYRSSTRKKDAYEDQGQGTLFDNYCKGPTAA